jgi:hypothetical protein
MPGVLSVDDIVIIKGEYPRSAGGRGDRELDSVGQIKVG